MLFYGMDYIIRFAEAIKACTHKMMRKRECRLKEITVEMC